MFFLDLGEIWEPSWPPNDLPKPLKIDLKADKIFEKCEALKSQLKRKIGAKGSQNLVGYGVLNGQSTS